MRDSRIFQPWMAIAAAGLVAIAVIEARAGAGVSGFLAGALGALAGVIALPIVLRTGLLIGSAVFGLRIRHIVLGSLRLVGRRKIGRVTVTVRMLPVTLAAEIGPWRSPVILRSWLAGLTSAVAGVAATTACWLVADGSFGRGLLIAVTPMMVHKLWPRRAPLATSTGWLLFGLPRMSAADRAEFRAGAAAGRAHEALQAGEIERSQTIVDELAAEHPDLHTTVSCQVSLLEARGQYAQAVMLLLQHISANDLSSRDMAHTLAGLAGLGFSAVEAEQAPADDLLPVARKALTDAVALGFPEFELSSTFGLLALLDGDADEAVRLASSGADHDSSPLSRADGFATVARAHMARRDNTSARDALIHAERIAPWLPRVQETRQRLSV